MRKLWSLWKRFGQAMGDFIARLILTLFYFTIFAPFGLGVRLWGDPLAIKERAESLPSSMMMWEPRATTDTTLEQARRQF